MSRIRALLLLPLLGACAGQPLGRPEIAALMPMVIADQQRQSGPGPEAGPEAGPGVVARYASPSGNRSTLSLAADPALANRPNGAPAEALEPHLRRANLLLGRELLRRGEVPGLARMGVVTREQGDEAICILAPVSEPPSLEALCLAVVSGNLATARITVGGIRGTGRERSIYAAHMAHYFFRYLRRAAPRVILQTGEGGIPMRDDTTPPFPERIAPAEPAP